MRVLVDDLVVGLVVRFVAWLSVWNVHQHSSFDAVGAVANVCVAVIAVGNDDGVHRPPEVPQRSADIAGLVFQYLLIGMYSFR